MHATTDRFTRPLVESVERRDFTTRLGIVLALTVTPAQRVAVGNEFAETMRKKKHAFFDALERVDAERERDAREPARKKVAVGADGCGQPPCAIGPNTDRRCYVDNRRLCDYDRVGFRTLTTAGNTIFTMTPEPAAGSAWWRPKATRMWAIRTDDPSIPAWEGLFITSITVGTSPVEGFNTPAAAGVQAGVFFGDYVLPDGDAIGVGWPIFSNVSNAQQLIISGIGLWPAAAAFIAGISVLGNKWDPSTATESRCHNGSAPLPPIDAYTSAAGTQIP